MLAPWCERAATDEAVMRLGAPSIDWWLRHYPGTVRNGSLVVAPARDTAELTRFAERTENYEWRDADGIAALEPDLAGRFRRALFFPREAHLEPRRALAGACRGAGEARRRDPLRCRQAADRTAAISPSTAAGSRRATCCPTCAACAARWW